MKTCQRCRAEKSESAFAPDQRTTDGLRRLCDDCRTLLRAQNTVTERTCPGCGEAKPADAFAANRRNRHGLQTYCKTCHASMKKGNGSHKRWYDRNREAVLISRRERYRDPEWWGKDRERRIAAWAANRERMNAKQRERGQARKLTTFAAYGGALCRCCGESNPVFLTIDHINGCTPELRKEQGVGSRLYQWLSNAGYPDGYQVLCFNCNNGRRLNGGVCPHQVAHQAASAR